MFSTKRFRVDIEPGLTNTKIKWWFLFC